MSTAQYNQSISPLFINHFRINSHLVRRRAPLWKQDIPRGHIREVLGPELCQHQPVATARLCNALKCEISPDRQLPGSEQINTISPGASFFNQRWNKRERSEQNTVSLRNSRICLVVAEHLSMTWSIPLVWLK